MSLPMNSPDPLFSTTGYNPPKPAPEGWLYAPGEYEAFVLEKMRRAVKRLKLLVGYPGVFRPPSAVAFYRNANPAARYVCRGDATASTDANGALLVRVETPDIVAALPALRSDDAGWEASTDGERFFPAVPGGVPTGDELPRVRLPLAPVESHPGLYDAGREILADITFHAGEKPDFTVGESAHEALHVTHEKDVQEQTFELEGAGDGPWRTPLPLAFRYLFLKSGEPASIEIDAAFTPLVYRRVYAFGDEELDRIWACSAYTLRLCIQTFQIDGVKRDRLPWGGDLAISLLANAYSFREPEPIRRTLTVLGRDGTTLSQVNGIIDYSLWIVISHEFYQEHFGDPAFLASSYGAIRQILDSFIERARADGGLIRPAQGDWCFIDWVRMDKTTALQMIFHWALRSGASLARRNGMAGDAARYATEADALRARIDAAALDRATGLYRDDAFNASSAPVRHANFLAVLAGVADNARSEHIARALLADDMGAAGTPYMIALEIWALHLLGHTDEALARLRRVWGGMLRLGATTFFEGWRDDFDEVSSCVFYDRPFGMSLCHAWSSAPCALLPILLGKD